MTFSQDTNFYGEIEAMVSIHNQHSGTRRLNRTLTISLQMEKRKAIQDAAAESSMSVSGYLSELLAIQNPNGFPVFKRMLIDPKLK